MITVKRIYEPANKTDGCRVLIDRLWPRGIAKEEAKLDYWLKEVAPSTELRKWFNHEPEKWPEFQRRYTTELSSNSQHYDELQNIIDQHQHVTLLYAAKDETHNDAVALKEFIQQRNL